MSKISSTISTEILKNFFTTNTMKKLAIIILCVLPLLLTGCWDKVVEETDQLKNDVTKAYDNLKKEAEEITTTIIDTKNKVEETTEDIKEAKQALDEVFE